MGAFWIRKQPQLVYKVVVLCFGSWAKMCSWATANLFLLGFKLNSTNCVISFISSLFLRTCCCPAYSFGAFFSNWTVSQSALWCVLFQIDFWHTAEPQRQQVCFLQVQQSQKDTWVILCYGRHDRVNYKITTSRETITASQAVKGADKCSIQIWGGVFAFK